MTNTSNGEVNKAEYLTQRERAEAWLAGLKIGAQVAVYRGYANRHPEVTTITGQTPRYWVVSHQRFRKDTGRLVGGSKWHSGWLAEPTPDIFEAAARRDLLQRLERVRWAALSTEWLRVITTALDDGMKAAQLQAEANAKEM